MPRLVANGSCSKIGWPYFRVARYLPDSKGDKKGQNAFSPGQNRSTFIIESSTLQFSSAVACNNIRFLIRTKLDLLGTSRRPRPCRPVNSFLLLDLGNRIFRLSISARASR